MTGCLGRAVGPAWAPCDAARLVGPRGGTSCRSRKPLALTGLQVWRVLKIHKNRWRRRAGQWRAPAARSGCGWHRHEAKQPGPLGRESLGSRQKADRPERGPVNAPRTSGKASWPLALVPGRPHAENRFAPPGLSYARFSAAALLGWAGGGKTGAGVLIGLALLPFEFWL